MTTLARVFPALAPLQTSDTDRVELVNQTIVEEVLQDLGVLDFGREITAETNIAIWRERGTHRPMCGEYAFEVKFKRRDELHEKAMERCKQFFIALQQSGRDWLSLGTDQDWPCLPPERQSPSEPRVKSPTSIIALRARRHVSPIHLQSKLFEDAVAQRNETLAAAVSRVGQIDR